MKKIYIVLSVMAAAVTSFGQGYVTVAGTAANYTNLTALTGSWTGGTNATGNGTIGATSTGQSYKMALLTSLNTVNPITALFGSGTSLTNTWLDTGLLGGNTTFAGRLSIGSDVQAANASTTANQSYILVAWSSNLGSTWALVAPQLSAGSFTANGYLGWSPYVVGTAGGPPTANPLILQGTGANPVITSLSMESVSVAAVPEPSTMALAALGGAALLAFRRRK